MHRSASSLMTVEVKDKDKLFKEFLKEPVKIYVRPKVQ